MEKEFPPALFVGLALGLILGLAAGYWLDNPIKAHEAFDSRVKCFAYYAPKMQSDKAATLAAAACEHLTPTYK